jgi:hypothetical protein
LRHLRKFVAIVIVLLVFSFLMISGPKATVSGDIVIPAGTTYIKDDTAELKVELTANSGDVINTSIENIIFKVYVPFPILRNVTINSSDISLSGSSGSKYGFDPSAIAYAYLSGYANKLSISSDYVTKYTGNYTFYAEINYTHIDDYGSWENATYKSSATFSVETAKTGTVSGAPGVNIYAETKNDITTIALGLGENISLKINHVYHIIKVLELKNNYVTLGIYSDPMTVKLNAGETKEIDVDGDGVIDLIIYLDGVSNGKAYLTFTVIAPKAETPTVLSGTPTPVSEPVAPTTDTAPEAPVTAAADQPVPLGTGIVTVVLLVISGIVVYIMVKRKTTLKRRHK